MKIEYRIPILSQKLPGKLSIFSCLGDILLLFCKFLKYCYFKESFRKRNALMNTLFIIKNRILITENFQLPSLTKNNKTKLRVLVLGHFNNMVLGW
jgi:hypothetical protein